MKKSKKSLPKRRAKWYLQAIGECPVCGKDHSYTEAQYTKPPPKPQRYIYLSGYDTYDYCND